MFRLNFYSVLLQLGHTWPHSLSRFCNLDGCPNGLISFCCVYRKQEILWQECHDKSVMKSLHVQEYAPETLVTGSMDGRVRVWDSSSGKILKSFRPCDRSRVDTSTESSWNETLVPAGNIWNIMEPLKQAPILCIRVGSTRLLTSHTDGTLTQCQFQF